MNDKALYRRAPATPGLLIIVKIIYCPYKDSTQDIQSNIPLCLQEFTRATPLGNPSRDAVYLTVYPSHRLNPDTVSVVECRGDHIDEVAMVLPMSLKGKQKVFIIIFFIFFEWV